MDVKPELSRKSVYEGRSDVRVLNPSLMNSYGFDVFYSLTEKSSDDELKMRMSIIANSLIVNPGGDNSFFYNSAQTILTAFLMYGFRKEKNFCEIIEYIMDASVEDLIEEILQDDGMVEHPKIKRLIQGYSGKDSDAFQDVVMTLQQDLSIFDVDSVKNFFDQSRLKIASPDDLVQGKSLFLAIPDYLLDQYRPIFRLIISLCLKYLTSIPEEEKTWERPIWFLIDEAGSIGPLPGLISEGLPRARSRGVQISLVVQSYFQLVDTYGASGAKAILDSCKNKIVLSCSNTETAKMMSDWTGTYLETKVSVQKRNSWDGNSNSISKDYRPVMDVSDINRLEADNKILVFAKEGFFLAQKSPFFKIKDFKEKSDVIVLNNDRIKRY